MTVYSKDNTLNMKTYCIFLVCIYCVSVLEFLCVAAVCVVCFFVLCLRVQGLFKDANLTRFADQPQLSPATQGKMRRTADQEARRRMQTYITFYK